MADLPNPLEKNSAWDAYFKSRLKKADLLASARTEGSGAAICVFISHISCFADVAGKTLS